MSRYYYKTVYLQQPSFYQFNDKFLLAALSSEPNMAAEHWASSPAFAQAHRRLVCVNNKHGIYAVYRFHKLILDDARQREKVGRKSEPLGILHWSQTAHYSEHKHQPATGVDHKYFDRFPCCAQCQANVTMMPFKHIRPKFKRPFYAPSPPPQIIIAMVTILRIF